MVWIKVYTKLLDKMEFHRLSHFEVRLLMSLWLLAADGGGIVEMTPEKLKWRLRLQESESDIVKALQAIERAEFIDLSSNTLAGLYQDSSLEERRGEERREEECREASTRQPPDESPDGIDEDDDQVVIMLPCIKQQNGSKVFPVMKSKYDEWTETYPGVNVLFELRKAKQWLTDNPSKQKRNVVSFLSRWMARAQDRPAQFGQGNDTRTAKQKVQDALAKEMVKHGGQ